MISCQAHHWYRADDDHDDDEGIKAIPASYEHTTPQTVKGNACPEVDATPYIENRNKKKVTKMYKSAHDTLR